MDDLSLIELSQIGNKDAFDCLIDRYYRNIYRFAFQFMGNHHDADEVCQETFLRAIQNISKLKKSDSFGSWIFTIATNLSRNCANKSKREQMVQKNETDAIGIIPGNSKSDPPYENLIENERKEIINKQLQEMPEQLRLVVTLVLMEGFSQKEVAKILGCSESSVCRQLETAKQWLSSKLSNYI